MAAGSDKSTEEMGFWDHLEALRAVLLRGAALIAVLAVAAYLVMPWLAEAVIFAPCRPDFVTYRAAAALASSAGVDAAAPEAVSLINYRLASQFFTHLALAFWLALVVGFPLLVWLLWGFVAPGLYAREKRGAARAFGAGCLLFYAGVAVGYYIVFPLTLRFLAGYQLSEEIPNTISLDSYVDSFLMLILMLGIMFELPVVTWLLGQAGVLSRRFFATYRRHAVVALLVLAAVITPTGDPFTLAVVFVPLYLLWELGALTVRRSPGHTGQLSMITNK